MQPVKGSQWPLWERIVIAWPIGVAVASLPWLVWEQGVDYNDTVANLFVVMSLPGLIIEFFHHGVHGDFSIPVVIVANSVCYGLLIQHLITRASRQKCRKSAAAPDSARPLQ
jgi:hypothetical protein